MKLSLIAATLAVGMLGMSAAEAMPMTTVTVTTPAPVVKVDYPCGPGWHLNDWGRCRPNRWGPPPPRYYYGHRPPPPPWVAERRWHRDRWERDRWDRRHAYGWE